MAMTLSSNIRAVDQRANTVAMPGDFKLEFINALRMRQIEQRSLIAYWTNDHCISSRPARAHCVMGRYQMTRVLLPLDATEAKCTPLSPVVAGGTGRRGVRGLGYADDTYSQGGVRAGLVGRRIALELTKAGKGERHVDVLRFVQAHHG